MQLELPAVNKTLILMKSDDQLTIKNAQYLTSKMKSKEADDQLMVIKIVY